MLKFRLNASTLLFIGQSYWNNSKKICICFFQILILSLTVKSSECIKLQTTLWNIQGTSKSSECIKLQTTLWNIQGTSNSSECIKLQNTLWNIQGTSFYPLWFSQLGHYKNYVYEKAKKSWPMFVGTPCVFCTE